MTVATAADISKLCDRVAAAEDALKAATERAEKAEAAGAAMREALEGAKLLFLHRERPIYPDESIADRMDSEERLKARITSALSSTAGADLLEELYALRELKAGIAKRLSITVDSEILLLLDVRLRRYECDANVETAVALRHEKLDLLERLRKAEEAVSGNAKLLARIAELEVVCDERRLLIMDLRDRIAELETALAEARESLKSFVEEANKWDSRTDPNPFDGCCPINKYRQARAAHERIGKALAGEKA